MFKEHIHLPRKYWILVLTAVTLMFGQIADVSGQNSAPKITIDDADDTYEQTLSHPIQFLQATGITSTEINKQLKLRPHIFIDGAGFVRNVELKIFTSIPNTLTTKSNIHVEGAGSVRDVGLLSFTEVPDQQSSKLGIHVAGAGLCAMWVWSRRWGGRQETWGYRRDGNPMFHLFNPGLLVELSR